MHPAGIILILAVLLAAILLLRSEWEKRQLSVVQYEIWTEKLREGARCVFLTDLHSAAFGAENERLIRKIQSLDPDMILMGGDMITCGKHTAIAPKTDVCLHLVEMLAEHYPVYYAEGNHELRMKNRFPDAYKIFTDHLMQMGVEYICNEHEIYDTEDLIEDAEDDIRLYGISMEQRFFDALRPGFGRKTEMEPDYLQKHLGMPDRRHFNILFLHSPLYLQEAAAWGADLVLSGHFHGGTIRIPKLGGLMTPQLQFLIRVCAGHFVEGDTDMIVSRGLGTHSVRIRLNDKPEITCIDIMPGMPKKR